MGGLNCCPCRGNAAPLEDRAARSSWFATLFACASSWTRCSESEPDHTPESFRAVIIDAPVLRAQKGKPCMIAFEISCAAHDLCAHDRPTTWPLSVNLSFAFMTVSGHTRELLSHPSPSLQ